MITRDNLGQVFDGLTEDEINEAFEKKGDIIALELNIFNVGGVSRITNTEDMTHSEVQEIEDSGNVVCDKDELLRLFSESSSINPFLLELL